MTHQITILFAALGAFLIGIVVLAVDVVRRNQRRIEAESRPIDTSLFQQLSAMGQAESRTATAEPAAPASLAAAVQAAEAAPASEAAPLAIEPVIAKAAPPVPPAPVIRPQAPPAEAAGIDLAAIFDTAAADVPAPELEVLPPEQRPAGSYNAFGSISSAVDAVIIDPAEPTRSPQSAADLPHEADLPDEILPEAAGEIAAAAPLAAPEPAVEEVQLEDTHLPEDALAQSSPVQDWPVKDWPVAEEAPNEPPSSAPVPEAAPEPAPTAYAFAEPPAPVAEPLPEALDLPASATLPEPRDWADQDWAAQDWAAAAQPAAAEPPVPAAPQLAEAEAEPHLSEAEPVAQEFFPSALEASAPDSWAAAAETPFDASPLSEAQPFEHALPEPEPEPELSPAAPEAAAIAAWLEAAAQSTPAAPMRDEPGLDEPSLDEPSLDEPEPVAAAAPLPEEPDTAAVPEPAPAEAYQTPEYQAPEYQAPEYQAMEYAEPAYAAPVFAEPAYAEPAYEPLPEPEPVAQAPEPEAPLPAAPVLVCAGFGAGFGDRVVLSNINLEIAASGVTVLMGPVGTGKSTLLRALAGMLSQSGLFRSWGEAYFRGTPVADDNRPLLVAQRIQLIRRSALENLTFHLGVQTARLPWETQRNWAGQWLTQAGAADVIPLLDRPFMELDQLSQRIVTILREAAAEPALLLIDEPTNGLSEPDATVLLGMLQRLAAFTPLLVVLHSHKHARKIADQVILLAGGQVQSACTAAEFFDDAPNQQAAQFLATGNCAVPVADAAAAQPSAPEPEYEPAPEPAYEPAPETASETDSDLPPPLTADTLEAIKAEIRSTFAADLAPSPASEAEPEAAPEAAPEPFADAPEPFAAPPEDEPPAEIIPVFFSAAAAPPDEPSDEPVLHLSRTAPPMIEIPGSPASLYSNSMVPAAPLPPRAATSQLGPDPARQQQHEREAVTRYPGAGNGPRGFVWIEDGRLAATPMPGFTAPIDTDLELLKNAGVTVLITLTEQDFPQDILNRHGLRNLHFPIADRKAPTTAETDVLVGQMHDMLDSGDILAVHCMGGLGRTGTVLAAYMVKEKGLSAQVALNQIRRFNRQFVQTDDQEDFLMEYEVQQEQTVLRNRAADGGKF